MIKKVRPILSLFYTHLRLSNLKLLPLKHKPPDLEKILQVDEREARPDAVGAQGAKVFEVDFYVRAPACGGCSAHAHHDHALRQIRSAEFREIEIAQLKLEVSADAIVKRIAAKTVKALAPRIKRRMRNHRGKTKHPRPPAAGRTVAHSRCCPQRLNSHALFHKPNVGIDAIDLRLATTDFQRLKCGGDMGKGVVCGKHIIGVQYANDVARRHLDAFVDGVIHSVVFLRKPTEVERLNS